MHDEQQMPSPSVSTAFPVYWLPSIHRPQPCPGLLFPLLIIKKDWFCGSKENQESEGGWLVGWLSMSTSMSMGVESGMIMNDDHDQSHHKAPYCNISAITLFRGLPPPPQQKRFCSVLFCNKFVAHVQACKASPPGGAGAGKVGNVGCS